MSRYIQCINCHQCMEQLAIKYNEFYKSTKGLAIKSMKCDNCGNPILPEEECYASVLLVNEYHELAKIQDPDNWAFMYITQTK